MWSLGRVYFSNKWTFYISSFCATRLDFIVHRNLCADFISIYHDIIVLLLLLFGAVVVAVVNVAIVTIPLVHLNSAPKERKEKHVIIDRRWSVILCSLVSLFVSLTVCVWLDRRAYESMCALDIWLISVGGQFKIHSLWHSHTQHLIRSQSEIQFYVLVLSFRFLFLFHSFNFFVTFCCCVSPLIFSASLSHSHCSPELFIFLMSFSALAIWLSQMYRFPCSIFVLWCKVTKQLNRNYVVN